MEVVILVEETRRTDCEVGSLTHSSMEAVEVVILVEETRRTDCEVGRLTHSSMIFEEITEVVVRGRRTGEVSARETLDIHRKCLRLHWERGSCWNLP